VAGKLYTGATTNNAYLLKESTAFSEGVLHREAGTLLGTPKADNPHVTASGAGVAWDAGWQVAEDASPSAIAQTAAPSVALVGNTVAA
jgi:hypothetical protein